MPSFNTLYYFHSPDIDLIEIKRTDLADDAPLSDRYKWLVLFPKIEKVVALQFNSIEKRVDEEIRLFTEGDFRFNTLKGDFNFLNQNYHLDRKSSNDVPMKSFDLIRRYLIEVSKRS